MTDLPLTLGRNLLSLTYESDLTERASRIAPIAESLGGVPTVLGFARWRITDPDSGPKTFVNEDPAGGAGAVGFTNQLVGMYVLLERTGESFRITATATDQTITLATWSSSIVAGEIFQLRLTAPGTQYTSYSYRASVASVLPPPPGIPIHDAEVTAIAGSVLTVRDGWLNGGPQPVASDGQHVGRSVRLSELVATEVITDFVALAGEYWYTVADVSAYQVGDWIRRAADNGATWYGDINTLITSAFPAAMTIVEIDSGANAFRVVSRDGGNSLNRVLFDTAVYGGGYTDVRIYRPLGTLQAVTASSGSAHTVTLDGVGTFDLGAGPGAIEFLIATTSTSGKVPWYLDHPLYVQEPPTGIGVQFRTIDRASKGWLGVQNLVPNPVARLWTTETSLPDGWLGAASLGAVGSATPSNFRIAKNTDPLFTRVGGQSLFVSVANGALYFPPVPWTPQYAGQRISVRVSMILTRWQQASSVIELQLGIMQSDGTVIPWYDQPRSVLIQPAAIVSGVPRPDPPFRKFAANVFDDLVLNRFDITEPSTYPVTNRPNTGDITNMSAGLGLVVCLTFNAGGGAERIEGYLDGVAMTMSAEAPADVKEFYEANQLHQDTNVALRELGPPQFEIAVDFFDAKRMNDTLDEPDAAKGAVGLFNAPDLGISNVRRRLTDVARNMLVPGETRLTVKKRRRIADAVKPAPSTKPSTKPGGTTTGGTSGGTSSGGSTLPSIVLDGVEDGTTHVPTVTATVGTGVISVKFAVSTVGFPDLATTQAATASTTPPFAYTGSAMSPGQTLYVSALAYDNNGVESGLAQTSIIDPRTSGTLIDRTGWVASAWRWNGSPSTTFAPDKAIDGSVGPGSTSWKNGAAVSIGNDYFQIDMGAAGLVGGFAMAISPDDLTDSPLSGDVQWSDDDVTYTTIASWTYSSDPTKASWTPASHRYWRFVATAAANGGGFWSIHDFNMYSDAAP